MTLRFNPEHNEMQVIIYAEKNLRLAVGHEAFSAAEQYYACGSLLKVIVLAKKKMFSFLILNAHTHTHTHTHNHLIAHPDTGNILSQAFSLYQLHHTLVMQ